MDQATLTRVRVEAADDWVSLVVPPSTIIAGGHTTSGQIDWYSNRIHALLLCDLCRAFRLTTIFLYCFLVNLLLLLTCCCIMDPSLAPVYTCVSSASFPSAAAACCCLLPPCSGLSSRVSSWQLLLLCLLAMPPALSTTQDYKIRGSFFEVQHGQWQSPHITIPHVRTGSPSIRPLAITQGAGVVQKNSIHPAGENDACAKATGAASR